MSESYKKLFIDPRALKPKSITKDRFIYQDAIRAIEEALNYPHITKSEKSVLKYMKTEIELNRLI